MSRSGYSDDGDAWQMIMWRGAVSSAIFGKRGQAFLKEMLAVLDAMPDKKLIKEELEKDGQVCAMGAVGKARGLDMSNLDPEEPELVAAKFGIARALAREIMYMNDEYSYTTISEEERFKLIRKWVVENIKHDPQRTDNT